VEKAWKDLEELTASGTKPRPKPLDSARQLQTLAESLPGTLPGRDEISAKILALSGSSEEVERGLMRLDSLVLQSAFDAMSQAEKVVIQQQVESTLDKLEQRLGQGSRPEVRQRLLDQTVRNATGLPFLSLFSPESSS
jgi:hypothetical protein